ncbi:MAG TPA: GlsB/YeaQ/YmgE family stress response membrane protein [Blastocatellia bacterium]|nr:GlsB/YeaQ/YmgE family stress response membrane protein [Blastocatellia bacterium]
MWEIITTAFVGLIVGLIARIVLPGRDPMGLLMTMIIGIAGSFLGKFLGMNILHLSRSASSGWIMSIIGAVILLLLYRLVASRRA